MHTVFWIEAIWRGMVNWVSSQSSGVGVSAAGVAHAWKITRLRLFPALAQEAQERIPSPSDYRYPLRTAGLTICKMGVIFTLLSS